ncbi:MAG: SDR family NAD(P)-dependent oxidoreductase [Achromobacter sp.]
MRIHDQVFLITGGASGLGASTAHRIAQQGGYVLAADVNEKAGAALVAGHDGRIRFCATDVTDETAMQAAVDAARQAWGKLDGLVCCAGIAPASKVLGKSGPHPLADFVRVLSINLVGTFNAIRLAADAMTKNAPNADGERGVILCTASIAAFEGQIGQAAYSASKAGITGMTLPIARELAAQGIRVVTIAPGLFSTPMMDTFPAHIQAALGQAVPFPARLGKSDEYAHLAQALIENCLMNGATVRLDGAVRLAAQ